jgi:polysaccharide export outer membrane protein
MYKATAMATIHRQIKTIWAVRPLAAVAWVLLAACATSDTQHMQPDATAATAYRVQAFDTMQITVFQEPDLSIKGRVSEAGTIKHPLLGEVPVVGLTTPEIEAKFVELLSRDYLTKPRVTVSVESSIRRRVVILGQVKSPGTFEIPPDETLTVLQLIARAGGFTDVAASDRITVARNEDHQQRKIMVNVAAIIKSGDSTKDIQLKPGDVVSVPETLF